MRIKISGKSLSGLMDVCDIDEVNKEYTALCDSSRHSFISNLKSIIKSINLFDLPPSLRMFNYKEYSLKGDTLKKAVKLRKLWHNIWSLQSMMASTRYASEEDILLLDEFETEVVLAVKSYYNFEIETFT